ncbi:MAG: U32 family peptidase [Kiritimatiellae bacterium]|nr:U32 family peptidase [Kiritimatiellia bacterium]
MKAGGREMPGPGVELLAPAGNFAVARAAFAAGADAVYCGLADFSARAFADNFSTEDMRDLLRLARSQGRKVYVTFNTVIDECDVERAVRTLAQLDELHPDAIIVQDLGVARICRRHFPGLCLHASTQLVAHNLEGVLALRELGFRRVVLARELSLAEIESVARRCGVEIEVFIHGALCYSLSGLCLFGAMEKGRSGNRGKCPYCCRQGFPVSPASGGAAVSHPFSMKDLRLGEDVRRLADAGVASLKIEGRMKSELYVASVTRYYRQILDRESGTGKKRVSVEDLETVFSRRTTELYFHGRPVQAESPIDIGSPGHVGSPVGTVKHVTKDRDGRSWLRFHTRRALEKHDGLQFEAVGADGRRLGMGIAEMRQAISRRSVLKVDAGTDVEILLPDERGPSGTGDWAAIKPGSTVFCSMSNAVKRMFPTPSFRPSDLPGGCAISVEVDLSRDGISCRAVSPVEVSVSKPVALEKAKSPGRTVEGVRKAFAKLGGTDYSLGRLSVNDPEGLFAPPSVMNDIRRELVERLDAARAEAMRERVGSALEDVLRRRAVQERPNACRRLKMRPDQAMPPGEWDEVVVTMGEGGDRVATPVYTAEPDFARLRADVKRLIRKGCDRWEASDLAALRMLRSLGVEDVTADWTLYTFNTQALQALADLGVRRFVASPENAADNMRALAGSGFDVEFVSQQSTPLFISLTEPAMRPPELTVFRIGSIWVTTRPAPRTFVTPPGASTRVDISWDR